MLAGNKGGRKKHVVLLVRPTPIQFAAKDFEATVKSTRLLQIWDISKDVVPSVSWVDIWGWLLYALRKGVFTNSKVGVELTLQSADLKKILL